MATKKKSLPKAQTIGQTGSKKGASKRYSATGGYNPFEAVRNRLASTYDTKYYNPQSNAGPINTSGPREINTQKKGGSVRSKSKKK